MPDNWTKEQVERVVKTAFFVENRDTVNLDVEHADWRNIQDIIRWAKENGWDAIETPGETVQVSKKTK